MSMLVRRGTMCHRNSKRIQQHRRQLSLSKKRIELLKEIELQTLKLSSKSPIQEEVNREDVNGKEDKEEEGDDEEEKENNEEEINNKEGNKEEVEADDVTKDCVSIEGESNEEKNEDYDIKFTSEVQIEERTKLADKSSTTAGMPSYGSFVYQIQDATREANTIWEFVCKALKILSRTRKQMATTVFLCIVLIVPFLMFVIGVKYLHECPLEPQIPIYLLVGGCFGTFKFLWLLCRQIRSRRYEHIDDTFAEDGLEEIFSSTSYRATDVILSFFLVVWFILGNYWVIKIYKPNYEASLWQPNDWCSKTVYIFAVVQLIIVHILISLMLLLCLCLCCGQICLSYFGDNYK